MHYSLSSTDAAALDNNFSQSNISGSSESVCLEKNPLLVPPQLALLLGLEEAIFLQQMHYWLEKRCGKVIEGFRWIYNTYEQWSEQFPFLSLHVLKRAIANLEKLGIIESKRHDENLWNQRKYYRINYEKLKPLQLSISEKSTVRTSDFPSLEEAINGSSYTETPPESSSETSFLNTPPLTPPKLELEPEREEKSEGDRKTDVQEEPGVNQDTLASLVDPEPGSKKGIPASLKDKPILRLKPKIPNRDECSGVSVVHETQQLHKNSVVHETQSLLANLVFIQWWCNRVEKTIGPKLALTPEAFVKGQIRSNPQTAWDMFESFQQEMTSRVENINLRQESGMTLATTEYEEVVAIAPYSLVAIDPPTVALSQLELTATTDPALERAREAEMYAALREREKADRESRRIKPRTYEDQLAEEDRQQKHKQAMLNQLACYDESNHLGEPNPSDFELFWNNNT